MRNRFTRPLFGPFRRRTRTGVPADHFPPARQMFGDGRTALVAAGPEVDDQDDDPTIVAQALDAVIDSIETAMAGDQIGQANDLIAAADVLADKLIDMLGGVDADEPPGQLARLVEVRQKLGLAGTMEEWWFPDSVALDAFVASMDPLADKMHGASSDRARILDELSKVGATRETIDGGVTATVLTGEPTSIPDGGALAAHDTMTGPHSHSHSHGDGTTHKHVHFHNDSNVHNHSHAAATVEGDLVLSNLSESERRRLDPDNEITDPEQLAAMVASAFDARGGLEAWTALRESKGLTAATAANGEIEPAAWHAYLCAEGIRTDDGRELMPMSCRFPDLPVSLRLLVEDEGGHWGAVTCGRIDTMERQEKETFNLIYSTGLFGSDPNGQLAEVMVEEQTQRFISIDPRDATGEYIEVRIGPPGGGGDYDYDDIVDCWFRIMDCVIGAATIVAMPAIQNAVITLSSVALPDAPIATATAPPSLPPEMEPDAVTASGAQARPRREWFDDPNFGFGSDSAFDARGDERLVLQADEKSYACPLTVTTDEATGLRRFVAHVAWWECEHTGFPGRKVKPPRSKSGYAYYLTGPGVECVDGTRVEGVGVLTMGCGHAPMTKMAGSIQTPLTASEAIAHYDGGYGAVHVGVCRAGQDAYGPWIAGYVPAGVTDEQFAEFMRLGPSGDWREVAGNLEMIAVLQVPVQGFPVRRAISASGAPEVDAFDTRVGVTDDRVYALVAAGHVRRRSPEQRIAHLESTVNVLVDELASVSGRVTSMSVARAREAAGL